MTQTLNRRVTVGLLVASGACALARPFRAASTLKPLTAAEFVAVERSLGNQIGLAPEGYVYILNMDGVRCLDFKDVYYDRLRLWADACRAKGYRYIEEVADFLDAELEDKAGP